MLISPLTYKEFNASSFPNKEVRKKPFTTKKTEEEKPEAPPPPPTFSEEELRAAERDAYQRGFLEGTKDGHAQAQVEHTEIERVLTEGLENFVSNITPVFEQYRNHCKQLKQDMPILALSIAQKVAGDALTNDSKTVIEAAAKKCAEIMINEPQVTVTINSRLASALSHKLKQISTHQQAASQVVVIANAEISTSDYRIEWKNGSIERQIEKIWQQIDIAIENMLTTIANEKEDQFDLLNIKSKKE
ncbi:MAG: FliH/SctL family protein [Rickettsiales bacterium]|jgi:flagellar assembly protein FliH